MEEFQQSKNGLQSYAKDRRVAWSAYFTTRWLVLYAYVLLVSIATPNLPSLIEWASSNWSSESVSGFVLGVEIVLGSFLIALCVGVFFITGKSFYVL